MPPHGLVGWIVFALGVLAAIALWFIPTDQLRSGLAGILLLIISLFSAYFGLGTWLAAVCGVAGVVCLAVFWFSDPPGGRRGGI